MILIQRIKKIKGFIDNQAFAIELGFFVITALALAFYVYFKLSKMPVAVIIEPNQEVQTATNTDNLIFIGPYVASKRGKYVYPADSVKAKNLKKENLIYFETVEEAKKLGFKPYFDD